MELSLLGLRVTVRRTHLKRFTEVIWYSRLSVTRRCSWDAVPDISQKCTFSAKHTSKRTWNFSRTAVHVYPGCCNAALWPQSFYSVSVSWVPECMWSISMSSKWQPCIQCVQRRYHRQTGQWFILKEKPECHWERRGEFQGGNWEFANFYLIWIYLGKGTSWKDWNSEALDAAIKALRLNVNICTLEQRNLCG